MSMLHFKLWCDSDLSIHLKCQNSHLSLIHIRHTPPRLAKWSLSRMSLTRATEVLYQPTPEQALMVSYLNFHPQPCSWQTSQMNSFALLKWQMKLSCTHPSLTLKPNQLVPKCP